MIPLTSNAAMYFMAPALFGRCTIPRPPTDLPVAISDQVRFVINVRAVKSLMLEIPPRALAHADD